MRILLLLLLCLSACGASDAPAKEAQSACRQQLFEGSRFTICDPKNGELRLFAARTGESPIRSFAKLSTKVDASQVAFAMNAGMFNEEGRPIGMTNVDGRSIRKVNLRDGPGNFHLKPNGVFMVTCNGRPAIFRSDAIPQFRCAPRLATQSGPMLVIAGKVHPKFDRDGSSKHIRNGVGVTDKGQALFVISQDPVSLGKFARFYRDALKTPNALFFDGSVSSLWDPASHRMDSHSPLGPIIVAFRPTNDAEADPPP